MPLKINILINTYSFIEPKDINNIKLNKNDSLFRFRSGGQYITFDELALIVQTGSNTFYLEDQERSLWQS